jgi:AcrR family transcriptional regulator
VRSAQRILDATVAMIESSGFGAVNVAAVAKAAGVSRQTVYSIFVTREELVSQAMIMVMLEILQDIRARTGDGLEDPEYVVELLVAGRGALQGHPVLTRLLVPAADSPVFDVDVISRAIPVVRDLLHGPDEQRPALARDDVAEMVTRMALSVVLFPSPAIQADDALRGFLRRWLVPLLPVDS